MMQETRQHILEILRETGQATVDDIVDALRQRRGDITAVTVRHHLNHLQKEGLIAAPQLRHRSTPGRPQHVYSLTEEAQNYFPDNYRTLAETLLNQMDANLPPEGINVIMQNVADTMAQDAQVEGASQEERLKAAIEYLNEHGYKAAYEKHDEGFVLHMHNCPYHHLANRDEKLCSMDMRLIATMMGAVPRIMSRASEGDPICAYLIPYQDDVAAREEQTEQDETPEAK